MRLDYGAKLVSPMGFNYQIFAAIFGQPFLGGIDGVSK